LTYYLWSEIGVQQYQKLYCIKRIIFSVNMLYYIGSLAAIDPLKY
jgi:hypothetical protein